MGKKIIDGYLEVFGNIYDTSGHSYAKNYEVDEYVRFKCLPLHTLTLVKASEYDESGASGTEIIFTLTGFAIDIILNAAIEIFGKEVTMEQIVEAFNSPDTPKATKSNLYQGLLQLWLTSVSTAIIGIYPGSKISERWSPILSVTFDGEFKYMESIDGVDTISTGHIATYDRISYGENE